MSLPFARCPLSSARCSAGSGSGWDLSGTLSGSARAQLSINAVARRQGGSVHQLAAATATATRADNQWRHGLPLWKTKNRSSCCCCCCCTARKCVERTTLELLRCASVPPNYSPNFLQCSRRWLPRIAFHTFARGTGSWRGMRLLLLARPSLGNGNGNGCKMAA